MNKAPGFIYSTAPSPLVMGAALKAWDMVKDFTIERINLFALANSLRNDLEKLGFNVGNSTSHIIPLIFGKEEAAWKHKNLCYSKAFLYRASVPPQCHRALLACA